MKRTVLIVTLIVHAMLILAQTDQVRTSYSLKEAQSFALENNPNVMNARLDIEAAEQRIWENTATGLPQIRAAGSYNNNLQLMTTLIPAEFFGGEPGTFMPVKFGTQHNATASVIANQLLFNGPYIVGLQAANTYKDMTEKAFRKSEADIKETVAQSYYSILLAEAGRDAFKASLENMNKRLEETRAMFEAGFLEETDVDQIQIAVSTLENEYNSAAQMAELSYRFLIYQMGYDMNTRITISETLDQIIAGLTQDLIEQEFRVEEHIDYKIFNIQEQLALLQVKMNKYEYMPTITASLTHQQMAMRNEFNFTDGGEKWYPATVLGVNLSVPVFSSGMRKAKIGQSKVELDKAKNNKTNVISGLELGVQQARIDFRTAYQKYLNQKSNIELSHRVFDRTSEKYRSGLSSSLDLTVASEQLTNSQTGFIKAIVDLLTAKLRLEKALGNL